MLRGLALRPSGSLAQPSHHRDRGLLHLSKDFLSAPAQDTDVEDAPAATGDDFCATHVCIPNYDNGTGTTVQCADGTYSHSGGKQGACSHHGGVGHDVRRMAARVARITLSDRLAMALAAAARATA